MKTSFYTFCLSIALVIVLLTACKKKEPTLVPHPINSRIVKYEFTGDYSGQLNIAYTNASGALESLIVTSLPWTKEITYNSSVGGAGIGGNTAGFNTGGSNQSVIVKL